MIVQDRHYRVDCKIDGKWFSNDIVFASSEEAVTYGEKALSLGATERYRLIETGAAVNLPDTEENGSSDEDGPSLFSTEDQVNWTDYLEVRVLCPSLFSNLSGGSDLIVLRAYDLYDRQLAREECWDAC